MKQCNCFLIHRHIVVKLLWYVTYVFWICSAVPLSYVWPCIQTFMWFHCCVSKTNNQHIEKCMAVLRANDKWKCTHGWLWTNATSSAKAKNNRTGFTKKGKNNNCGPKLQNKHSSERCYLHWAHDQSFSAAIIRMKQDFKCETSPIISQVNDENLCPNQNGNSNNRRQKRKRKRRKRKRAKIGMITFIVGTHPIPLKHKFVVTFAVWFQFEHCHDDIQIQKQTMKLKLSGADII